MSEPSGGVSSLLAFFFSEVNLLVARYSPRKSGFLVKAVAIAKYDVLVSSAM